MKNYEVAATHLANGVVHYVDHSEQLTDREWSAHPQFSGVSLKTLIEQPESGGAFSSHLVKIDPGGCLEPHCHPDQLELHEVMEGSGQLIMNGAEFSYHWGKMAVIPKGCRHSVQAGDSGLTLLAKFFPAN